MKKLFLLGAVALMGAFMISTTAMAYDDLFTNDTAAVKEAGGLCGSASILYTTASERFDSDSEAQDYNDDATQLRIPIRVNYGVMDKLTVFGVIPFASIDNKDMGVDGESGIGDMWLGAKYAVMPEGMLTVRGALGLPLGDDDKGLGALGGFGVDVAAMTAKQVDKIGMNAQVGVRWAAEDGDTKLAPGIGIYFDAEGDYAFSEAFKGIVGIEFMTRGDLKYDGDDVKDTGDNYVDLNVGACYKLGDKMGLRGDVMYTLAGKNTDKNLGILVRLGYMVK